MSSIAVPVPRPKRKRRRSTWEVIVSIASPIVLLVAWELLARLNVIDARILPPPTKIIVVIGDLAMKGILLPDIGATSARYLSGLAWGAIPGTVIGLSMGFNRWIRAALRPLVAVFYPIPHIALFPLVLILSGLNERSNLILVAIGPFFTMLIVAMSAVRNLPPIYLDVARSFRERPLGVYTRVILPATLPELFGAFRVSLGLALVGAVAVEFLTGSTGLGSFIWNSWQVLSLANSMAGLVCVAIIGAISFVLLGGIERLALPWRPRERDAN